MSGRGRGREAAGDGGWRGPGVDSGPRGMPWARVFRLKALISGQESS